MFTLKRGRKREPKPVLIDKSLSQKWTNDELNTGKHLVLLTNSLYFPHFFILCSNYTNLELALNISHVEKIQHPPLMP